MGGHTHVHTHLPTLGPDGCCHGDLSLAESCPLSWCWFVSISSFLHFLFLPPSSPTILFLPTLLFICLCFHLYSSSMAKMGFQKNTSDKSMLSLNGSISVRRWSKKANLTLNKYIFSFLNHHIFFSIISLTFKHPLWLKQHVQIWTTS